MAYASYAADLIKLQASHHYRMTRTDARAAGLSVFHGPTYSVRGHGNVRTVLGSHCVACVEAAASIKQKAKESGRESALKAARAELAREQKAAERARLKEEAAALKAQQKAAALKAARAAERTKRKAERQATQAPQVAPTVPVRAILCTLEDDDDGRPPWE